MSMNKPNAVDLIHFMEVLRILKCVWSGMYTKKDTKNKGSGGCNPSLQI